MQAVTSAVRAMLNMLVSDSLGRAVVNLVDRVTGAKEQFGVYIATYASELHIQRHQNASVALMTRLPCQTVADVVRHDYWCARPT